MNEIEIVYFSLYLDKIGWITDGYQIDENLMITGLSVKVIKTLIAKFRCI